ncbi:MAG: hypothetical protein WD872_13500, partial [Pirellulaceae bacterium]
NEEQGQPIDASGSYLTQSGEAVQFGGVRDLAKFLAASEETHAAFVQQLFHNQVKQPVLAFGSETLADLRQLFERHEFNIRKLTVQIIATSALSGDYESGNYESGASESGASEPAGNP